MGKLSVHEGESLDKLRKVVGNGCKNLGAADHTGLEGYSFIVQEDTVISVLTVDGANATTAYGLGAAVTVKAGAYFVVPDGSQITAMTIDSGSVIIYNL